MYNINCNLSIKTFSSFGKDKRIIELLCRKVMCGKCLISRGKPAFIIRYMHVMIWSLINARWFFIQTGEYRVIVLLCVSGQFVGMELQFERL